MSIYSGLPTRAQQTKYNKLLCKLIRLMQHHILYLSQSVIQPKYANKYRSIVARLENYEQHKYLPPKFSQLTIPLMKAIEQSLGKQKISILNPYENTTRIVQLPEDQEIDNQLENISDCGSRNNISRFNSKNTKNKAKQEKDLNSTKVNPYLVSNKQNIKQNIQNSNKNHQKAKRIKSKSYSQLGEVKLKQKIQNSRKTQDWRNTMREQFRSRLKTQSDSIPTSQYISQQGQQVGYRKKKIIYKSRMILSTEKTPRNLPPIDKSTQPIHKKEIIKYMNYSNSCKKANEK